MKSTNHYQITVLPSTRNLPAEGPTPLIVSLTYIGKDTVTIIGKNDDFLTLAFETQPHWRAREKKIIDELTGIQSEFKLTEGQLVTQTIHLHDFFSKITPGHVELPITISFWEKINNDGKMVSQSLTCKFKVLKPDEKDFNKRLQKIHQEIKSTKNAEKRLAIYQGLSAMEHPQLITIFLEALVNKDMLIFHHTARNRLVELTEQYKKREQLIEHLSSYGTRYDYYFFQLWKNKGIVLSDLQNEKISQSSSLWIRVFCLENYPGPFNRKGVMESLKMELKELQEKVQKLK